MSYHSVRADAFVFDPLNGSTIGTVTGTTTWAADGPLGRQAFVGDGSSFISYTPPVTFPTTATLAGWFKIPTNDIGCLLSLRNSLLTYDRRDGQIIYAYDGAGRQTSYDLPDNTLFHLALVANGTTFKYYINGTETGSIACGNLVTNGSNSLRVLAAQGAPPVASGIMAASAAEFGYWNRALTGAEISELYALEEPLYTSGSITLNADLSYSDDLIWESYSNGTVTETTTPEHFVGGQWEEDPDFFTNPVPGRDYRVRIAASNNGGNDPDEDQVSNTVTYVAPSTALRRNTHPLVQPLVQPLKTPLLQ